MEQLNYNHMENNAGILVIPDMPYPNYFLQRCMLPAIRLVNIPTGYQNGTANISGETLTYDPLVVDMLADENNLVRDSLIDWMVQTAKSDYPKSTYKDLVLHVHTRNRTAMHEYVFVGAHVTDVEQLSFDTTLNDTTEQSFSVTIQYQYYYKRE